MRKIEKLLIAAGVILFANYIIHLPMCVKDYANKDFGIYSTQTMHKHSTLTMSAVLKPASKSTLKFYISPHKSDFIFDYTNNFYAIINISVYIWQFPRANISGIIAKRELMFGYSHKPDIYCSVSGNCNREGYLWIIRKRLLRWLKNARIIIG